VAKTVKSAKTDSAARLAQERVVNLFKEGRRAEADRQTRQVVMGDDVFIGSRVTLLKGCHIGNGCMVAAGAVVTPGFEAPPMSIVAGNPARVVGQVKPAASAATPGV